jgi:L-asparaginase/beta-aspartyl-peptidase (threonine type)
MAGIVITHCGTNSLPEWSDGCARAADEGVRVLRAGGTALDAAVAAVKALEDDGRYNAGLGSVLRFDGETIENDAGVMDSAGRLGAVAALRGFRHPVDAARAALSTPHVLYAGEGAARLAAAFGLEPRTAGPTEAARRRWRRCMETFRDLASRRPQWRDADPATLWNFPGPLPPELRPTDTVGALALDDAGLFAAAGSTGGSLPMLLGRVGDTPVPGAGFWAGPAGAVHCTGVGEEILRRCAARAVYDHLAAGAAPAAAVAEVAAAFPADAAFGAIALSPAGAGHGGNCPLPVATARA